MDDILAEQQRNMLRALLHGDALQLFERIVVRVIETHIQEAADAAFADGLFDLGDVLAAEGTPVAQCQLADLFAAGHLPEQLVDMLLYCLIAVCRLGRRCGHLCDQGEAEAEVLQVIDHVFLFPSFL